MWPEADTNSPSDSSLALNRSGRLSDLSDGASADLTVGAKVVN